MGAYNQLRHTSTFSKDRYGQNKAVQGLNKKGEVLEFEKSGNKP